MSCSFNSDPWDKIWKCLGGLKAPIIFIKMASAATTAFPCQAAMLGDSEDPVFNSELSKIPLRMFSGGVGKLAEHGGL